MSDNKIIKFPVDKVKQKKSNETKATKLQQSAQLKKAVPATIFTILCLYIFSNAVLISNTEEKKELRGLASKFSEFKRDVAWEHRLAKQLAVKSQKRGIASVGKSPHLQDELTAGLLHNKYRVEFSSGKIVNIELADTLGQVDPAYIDGHQFLRSYKKLLPFKYENAKRTSKVKEENKVLETYKLMDSDNKVLGNVKFELDVYGRLLAMKVQKES